MARLTAPGGGVTDVDLTEIAAAANVRGDILYTHATPAWATLAKGTSGQVLTSGATDVAWATPAASATYETSLPGSPTDGQEVFYAADATNGVIWHLRYRSGASGSYKWEFVGGPALMAYVATVESTTNQNAYEDLATVGPSITVPLAGDYEVRFWMLAWCSITAPQYASMSYGGAAPAGEILFVDSQGGNQVETMSTSELATGLTASSVAKVQYKANAGTASFSRRRLWMIPRRVG